MPKRKPSGAERIYWSKEGGKRRYYHLTCRRCGARIWTSSNKGKDFVCISCKRAAGLTANGRRGRYSTLATSKQQIPSYGICSACHRIGQSLSNGRCEDCRFYDDADGVDPELSERGKRGRGKGTYDYTR